MRLTCLVVLLVSVAALVASEDLINTKIERSIELTTHLVHINNVITVENKGSGAVKSYTYSIEPSQASNVAFVGARVF